MFIITGATGFIGQNLQAFFRETEISTHDFSLWDADWKEKFPQTGDALIHLAGKAHDTKNTADPEEYFQVNTELTQHVFDRFLQSEIRDFIFFSSVKAVADSVEGVLTEETVPNPQTPYGQSKLQAEKYLMAQPLPEGKRLIILRPCMIHGPGNKGNLNLLYKVVKKGIPWPLADFENKRSFLSVDNLCFLIAEILKNKSLPSGTYQCADDKAISTNELVTVIAQTLNKTPRLWFIPQGMIKGIAKAGDKLHLPLTTERLGKLTENYIVSNTKIKTALGINELPLSAKEGLVKTIRSFNA